MGKSVFNDIIIGKIFAKSLKYKLLSTYIGIIKPGCGVKKTLKGLNIA